MNAFLHMLAEMQGYGGKHPSVESIDAVAVFLLILLGGIAAVAGFFVLLAKRHVRKQKLAHPAPVQKASFTSGPPEPTFSRSYFESPDRWLVVRSNDLQVVQDALHLHNAKTCSWEEGLAEARDHKLFISPPIGQWIIIMGSGLPDPAEDADKCFHFVTALSRKLSHVQYFSVNRVLFHHAWVRAEAGNIIRAYAWAGETVWDQGLTTAAETELRLHCVPYGDETDSLPFPPAAPFQNNVEKVPMLASRWSIDPTTLDERVFRRGQGIAGESSSTKPG